MMGGVSNRGGQENTDSPLVVAVDIGTSSVRAALYDASGQEISGTVSRVVRQFSTTRDGGAEDDPEEAIATVARVIDNLLAQTHAFSSRIDAVAVSCFWHSLIGVDVEGQAITPLFGWADTRSARWTEELRRRFDERAVHARTGCRFHSSYWPARLLWLKDERAFVYSRVHRWMSFGEFLMARFFGNNFAEASASLASGTGMLNLRDIAWDAELVQGLDIDAEQLPTIASAHKAVVGLAPAYARRWPSLNRASWFPAIGDGAANNLGAGCVTRSSVALMVGTSGAMRVLYNGAPPAELPHALWCYRADRERVVVGGALSDGGGLYGWMNEALAVGFDEEELSVALASMKPDAHGLTLLPFWSGERSTNWAMHARGAILGLTMHTSPLEILRAAMEAISYRFALIAHALDSFAPGAEIIASGGALAASPVWVQIICDVLGRPLKLSGTAEASSRGAVLLALEATGKINRLEDAPAPPVRIFEPDMAHHARYLSGLERQQKIYRQIIGNTEIAQAIYEASATEP
ncbi:MAG TPA: gluconokinase [Pyrinomonadaceae bacterium]|nr:gluconokinase [Pyrinomonadaceae bacterium]